MGRIGKLKREAIQEANKRVLGIIKEDNEIEDIIDKALDLESKADYLESDIDDFNDELERYVDKMKVGDGSIKDDDLEYALDQSVNAAGNVDDAEDNLYDVQSELEEYMDDEEEDEDVPVGGSGMDVHLRGGGSMGAL